MTTIATTNQKVDTDKFNENFDKIFGKPKPVVRGSFIMDPETGKLVPKEDYVPSVKDGVNAPMIMKPLEAFMSPIDHTRIGSREQLAKHNAKHGVTNAADYNGGYIERKAIERVNTGQEYLKKTRRVDINRAFDDHTR